jgi:hypothetical protein
MPKMTKRAARRRAKQLAVAAAGAGAAMAAGFLVRQGARHGWRAAMDDDPPHDPRDRDTSWAQALGWAAATGALVAMAQLAARTAVRQRLS